MAAILVTGGAGQVGRELARLDWGDVELHAPARDTLDIAAPASVEGWLAAHPVDAIVNAAAWTAVDRAEEEVAAAFLANAQGPAVLAQAARRAGIPLVHVSTDYVFDGVKPAPYDEADPVAPLGVYGASKLAGELAVHAGQPRSVVLRTAWVLSAHRTNFLKTMLRFAAERPALAVVADQIGSPTGAADIAEALRRIALRLIADPRAPTGLYHFVNAGEASWAELAGAIMAASAARGGPAAPVTRIGTADYPTAARRPAHSRLATGKLARDYGIAARPWREAVDEIVATLIPDRQEQA